MLTEIRDHCAGEPAFDHHLPDAAAIKSIVSEMRKDTCRLRYIREHSNLYHHIAGIADALEVYSDPKYRGSTCLRHATLDSIVRQLLGDA